MLLAVYKTFNSAIAAFLAHILVPTQLASSVMEVVLPAMGLPLAAPLVALLKYS